MKRLSAYIATAWLAASTLAAAQNSAPLNPNDPAVSADFKLACAEEIKQAQAALAPTAWFDDSWVSLFRDWRAPGVFFSQIREGKHPQWNPYFLLRACASLTYVVQRKNGVGSGAMALSQWREMRAHFEKLSSEGTTNAGGNATGDNSKAGTATAESVVRPTAPANPVSVAQSSTGGAQWPPGVEPGNLYVIKLNRKRGRPQIILVSKQTKQEAVSLVQQKLDEDEREFNRFKRLGTYDGRVIAEVVECTGANWGAVAEFVDAGTGAQNGYTVAGVCGYSTPKQAIEAASLQCAKEAGKPCRNSPLYFTVGHSGANPWRGSNVGCITCAWPSNAMALTALGASTQQFTPYNLYVRTPEDAIAQFGKACGAKMDGRDTHSCWITTTNLKCIESVQDNPKDRMSNQHVCVDVKLTANGYLP